MSRPGAHVRASDEERDQVAASLAVHWRAVRIGLETFDARVARAYEAQTLTD